MERRRLGKTDIMASVLGFGGAEIGYQRVSSRTVARLLGEALDALEADSLIRDALPGEMYTVFMHYKRDEWNRFLATVSEWDIKEYLDILP